MAPETRPAAPGADRVRAGGGPGDGGSGSVLVLAVLLVAATGLVAAVWLAAALHAQARLRAAADLAALAAAERSHLLVTGAGACPDQVGRQARTVAGANRARLVECRIDAEQAVLVTVAPQGTAVRWAPARVSARAGIAHLPSWPLGEPPRSGGVVPAEPERVAPGPGASQSSDR